EAARRGITARSSNRGSSGTRAACELTERARPHDLLACHCGWRRGRFRNASRHGPSPALTTAGRNIYPTPEDRFGPAGRELGDVILLEQEAGDMLGARRRAE